MGKLNLENMSQTTAAHLMSVKVDNETTRKAYKAEKKKWVSKYCTDAKFVDLHVKIAEYSQEQLKQAHKSLSLITPFLVNGEVPKPVIIKGMSEQARKLAYVPFNENKVYEAHLGAYHVSNLMAERFSIKIYRKLMDKLVESFLVSLKTKYKGDFIINTLNDFAAYAFGFDDPIVGGQVINVFVDADLLNIRKMGTVSNSKHKQFMLKTMFKDAEELFAIKAMTDRHSSRMAKPKNIDKDSFIISQNTWRYEHVENSPKLIKAINHLNSVPLAFAEWVTEAHVEQAVREKLDSDALWVELEIILVLNEFRRIKANGNKFYIEHFIDGARRIYELKSHFGVQEGSSLRSMLRFYNKKTVTPKGIKQYLHCIEAEYGHVNLEQILLEHDDRWGWIDAVINPDTPTGSIAYRDATNQVVGLYGLLTGDELLMNLGGFTNIEKSKFTKAYKIYYEKMNTAIGVHYTLQLGKEVYPTCYNEKNVKSAVMTSLYNVSVNRVVTGFGYTPEEEDEEDKNVLDIEVDGEYETSKSKLGKLVPLLKTAREFETAYNSVHRTNIKIDSEDLAVLHSSISREILGEALKIMRTINAVVKSIKNFEMCEWTHFDGTKNQYAMVESKVIHVPWITTKSHQHSFKHHIKVLTSGFKWRGVPPRFMQSYDAGFIRGGACNAADKGYDLVGIHDSEGTHGNDMDDTYEQYIDDCVALSRSDSLMKDLSIIAKKNFKSLHSGRDLDEIEAQIRKSTLAFMA